jgi:hypothetical protein
MSALTTEDRRMEKLVRMELAGISRAQSAMALGVSESRVSQLLESDQCKEMLQQVSTENFEQNELVNKGWDSVETMSIARVVSALKHDPDPEFALKAAAIANKAVRRGTHNNTPIAQNMGVRAVIQLNASFVDKLQQNFHMEKSNHAESAQKVKDSNFLGAAGVQQLLRGVAAEASVKLENFGALDNFSMDETAFY